MTELRERLSKVDWIKWVSLSVPIIGTVWGVWEFFLKEIVLPSLTPANINMEVSITPISPKTISAQPNFGTAKTIPVELSLKVTSTGKHTLRVINPYWVAYGNSLEEAHRSPVESQQEIAARINERLGPDVADQSDRPANYRYGPYIVLRKLIGIGTLFIGEEIKPDEVIRSRRIIFVQPDAHDFLQVFVYVPTIKKQPNDRLDDVKVSVTNTGPPFYDNKLYFCRGRSMDDPPRSILERFGLRLTHGGRETNATSPRRQSCQYLSKREIHQFGAQIARSVYEKMLNQAYVNTDTNSGL